MNQQELLNQRYGGESELEVRIDNGVIDTLLAHRSVRHFKDQPLPEGTLELLIAAGQSAATSSNLQAWSVVSVEKPELRSELRPLCGGQSFVTNAPLYLIFCADLSRLAEVSEMAGQPGESLDYFELFLIAAMDAALAAQNVAVAAESLGLGICYNGGARNHPKAVARLLGFPPRVFSVFGMAIGYPADDDSSEIKPRLPIREVLYRDRYDASARTENVEDYDRIAQEFYDSHAMNVQGGWSEHSAKRVASPSGLTGRDTLRQTLIDLGFGLK